MKPLRHLLILSSANPDFGHSQAAQTVCALLTAECAGLVERVTLGLVCPSEPVSTPTLDRLARLGVSVVELGSGLEDAPPAPRGKFDTLRHLALATLLDDGSRDRPRPRNLRALAAEIDAVGADAALLFWDTLAEFAVPLLQTPVFGYLARPPQEAGLARIRERKPGLRRSMDLMRLRAQMRRHFDRLQRLRGAGNICALDSRQYAARGVACSYIPNSWEDPVGAGWLARREDAEAGRDRPHILGNIGALDATGNSFGMQYLGAAVLPRLTAIAGDRDWVISICGTRRLTPAVAQVLQHPRVVVKGFVADIDGEMLSSAIFLLLNNAGPYTGGYTRVIYAFATGACLIAHANLAASMPELRHGENCLLADTPDGIAAEIDTALRDPALRRRLGAAARQTYENCYAPGQVARQLVRMISPHHNVDAVTQAAPMLSAAAR
ncbi:MAG: glycosyltransferase [Ferrovibrio sp.]